MKPFPLRLDLETFRIDKTPIMIKFSGLGHISDWDHVSMTPFCGGRLVALMEEYYHTCSCHGTQLLPYIRGVTVLPGSKFSK